MREMPAWLREVWEQAEVCDREFSRWARMKVKLLVSDDARRLADLCELALKTLDEAARVVNGVIQQSERDHPMLRDADAGSRVMLRHLRDRLNRVRDQVRAGRVPG